jgi:hypothetical protein
MSFVKIAGVRTKISDLPPDIAATVRTALGPTRDPKADPGKIPLAGALAGRGYPLPGRYPAVVASVRALPGRLGGALGSCPTQCELPA